MIAVDREREVLHRRRDHRASLRSRIDRGESISPSPGVPDGAHGGGGAASCCSAGWLSGRDHGAGEDGDAADHHERPQALAEEDRREHDAEDGLERHHDRRARRPEPGEHDEEERERDRGRDAVSRRHRGDAGPDGRAAACCATPSDGDPDRGAERGPRRGGQRVGARDHAVARRRRRWRTSATEPSTNPIPPTVIATCPPPTATIAPPDRRSTSDTTVARPDPASSPSATSTTRDDRRVR